MKKTKHFLLVLLLTGISAFGFSQTAISSASIASNSAKIVFMRSTGFSGSATAFTTFIDDQLVCRLNNKRFSTHSIAAGEHTFSVQFAGKDSKEKAERIKINMESGKTYYIQLVFQTGLLINNIY